jgi:hypothetical protein
MKSNAVAGSCESLPETEVDQPLQRMRHWLAI